MTMTDDIKITKELIAAHGITPDEYERIVKTLGREPNITELGMYSVMWSEHCSYKNTKPVLKTFPTSGPRLLVRAGEENAGIVDIGDGLAICFKIESHNHPSAIEPFQGAATGVGGILRDIFTMGARPVLVMDSLRFGTLESEQTKHLLKGVVSGISHYGNCMGIPTIGGEIYFHESYEGNPLVNVLALGILQTGSIVKGHAKGEGNPVYYVGATTGRDGLGGAAFASRDLTEKSKEDRPAVQVGDPFMEKLLMEACLELSKTDALVGMQDMGAAGLTCSTSETAARANMGIEIDLAKVPQREEGMTPYEYLLSESQERMLVIVKKGKEKIVEDIFKKWDLHAVQIGEVKSGTRMRVFHHGRLVSDVPAKSLVDEGPVYIREEKRPAYLDEAQKLDLSTIPEPKDFSEVLKKLLSHPSIASKAWVWEQYDHMVRTDTVFYPGHDAGLVRIKGTQKGIAVSTDCNSLYCYLDPFEGGKTAVAEAARNVACTGAQPLAVTDNLNFGNPMNPEIFWQLRQCSNGITAACNAFQTPVTGGNVSLYNQNPKGAIYPTPTIGMVGLLEDIELRVPSHFQNAGDLIFLVGETFNEIGGSHYLMIRHGLQKGLPPRLDLERETALHRFLLESAKARDLSSAHDLSEGGLAVALAEACFACPTARQGSGSILGANVDHLDLVFRDMHRKSDLREDALYFGESQSRVVISAKPEQKESILKRAQSLGLPIYQIGKVVGEDEFCLGSRISGKITAFREVFEGVLPKRMKNEMFHSI